MVVKNMRAAAYSSTVPGRSTHLNEHQAAGCWWVVFQIRLTCEHSRTNILPIRRHILSVPGSNEASPS